jgi:hypothetical protein
LSQCNVKVLPVTYMVSLQSKNTLPCNMTYPGCTIEERSKLIGHEKSNSPIFDKILKGFLSTVVEAFLLIERMLL